MGDQAISAFPDEATEPKPTQAPATASKPDVGFSAFPQDNTDRLGASMAGADATPPDTAASIFDLQLKTGLPHEVIARNLDEVKKQASATDFDPVAFRKSSPLLAKWLDAHPLNASVAGDDLVPLSKLEHAVRLGSNAIRATGGGLISGLNMGAWGVLEMAGDVLGLPGVTAWAKEASNDAAAMAAGIKGDQRGAGPNEQAFYSGFESIGSSAPILAASFLSANPELALSLMGTQTGGQAYTQARAAGVSIPGSIAFGTSQGAIEAATEMLPVHALFGDIVSHAGLARTLAHQALLEVPGEQLATALQDLNEWAVLHPGTPFQDYLSARPSAAVQTLIATLVATGAQTAAVHTLNRTVQGLTAQRTIKDVGAAVSDSALGKRSPAKLQEFLESATKDTPLETVYAPVDTWTAFWQSKGVDPGAMAEQAGSSRQAYAEAAESGADLPIPMASYATAIAGTEHNAFWENELRLNPGEMNAREAEAFIAAHDEAVTSAATTEPTPNVQTIHAELVKHLIERGQMRPEDAETNAAVVSSMLENFIGKRAGLDPRTMFEARTAPGVVERVAGPEDIGTGHAVGTTASIDQTLFQTDAGLLDSLTTNPEAVAELDRRKATENTLPDGVEEDRRTTPFHPAQTDANAAMIAELERETVGKAVGAGGSQQTLENLRRDPTLAERARNLKGKTSADLLAAEQKRAGKTFNQGPVDGARAEFLAHGPDGPLFNIVGGPKHGSTVGLKSLQDLGIAAPEVPADTGEKLNGDQLRAKMIAARTIPKPMFQSAVEGENSIPAPIFFSRIVRAVEESKLAKATGSQWVATIKNYKGGINKGEATLLNVDALAPAETGSTALFPDIEKVYTKQEVLDHLAQNQLQVDVVELSGESVDNSDIEREAEHLREQDIESEADSLRQNYDEAEERDAVRQSFDPPSYDVELHEADPNNEDSVDYYTATIDGVVQLDYSIPVGRLNSRSERPALRFDTEEEAQAHVNEKIQELEDEYVDDNYSEPDFDAQARDSVDNNDTDYEDLARENLDGGGDFGDGGVHYEEYSVDGDHEDYAEVFLRVPELPMVPGEAAPGKAAPLDPNARVELVEFGGTGQGGGYLISLDGAIWTKANGDGMEVWNPTSRAEALHDAVKLYENALEAQASRKLTPLAAKPWVDGHGAYENIENPIVRIRLDTRESSAGKTLFLEEVQPPSKGNQKFMPELLLKNWRELAFKYAIRRAATEGHAAVAWATGSQQAQHYSLEKKVKQINWQKVDDKRRLIVVQPFDYGKIQLTVSNDGQVLEASEPRLLNQHVNDILGPEIYERMSEPEGQLNPEDLKMGGYGLKRLYDKDFVNVVNGLAAVKKAKGKVSTVTIVTGEGSTPAPRQRLAVGITPRPNPGGPGHFGWTLVMNDGTHWGTFDDEAEANRNLEAWEKPISFPEQTSEQNAILMTPELKAAVLGGQPMFQSGPSDKRGAISFNDATGRATISLFEKADLSTFPHETAHLFLELVGDTVDVLKALDPAKLTEQQQGVITDYDQVLLPFLGVSNRGAIGVEQHERFANAWEDYLMKGESPSGELRPIFARMKAWLLGVYRQVKRTITLTPEVKGFMDRLLASEDAIVAAEQDAKFTPLFTSAADAQMTPEQFELYRKDVELAAATARERLDAQVRADVAKEQTRVYKEQKVAIRTAVEAELEKSPIYRALSAMRDGTHPNGDPIEGSAEPLKLNRAQVVEILGENKTKTLPRPAIYTREGGLDPAHVATLFGFSSAAEMLESVGTTPRLEDAITAETDRRMTVAHGTLLTDGTLPAKAELAIANEGRDKIIRAEIRALQKLKKTVRPHVRLAEAAKQTQITALAGQVSSMQKTARQGPGVIAAGIPNAKTIAEAARQRIAKAQVRTIHPTLYWAAARKANQVALAEAAKQNFDGAIAAQTQQLLNLALYREAATVLEDVDKRVAAARSLDTPASRKRIGRAGSTYQDQIDGVLSRYEFAQVSEKTLARRAAMRKWAAGIEGEGFEVDLTDEQLDDARQVNYRELTYSELVGVSDGLKQIVHLATLKNKLLASVDARDFGTTREGLVDSIRANNLSTPLPLEFRPTDETRRRLAFAFASHRKIAMLARALDGHQDGGAFWESIIRPINAAADAKLDRSKKEIGAFSKILEEHFPGRELGRLHELLPIQAIQGSLSHEARLAVGLNWGTMEGRDRLLADPTRRWSQSQVEAILDTLDARDWKFIRATWDFNERFWPEIAAQQERVTGLAPEKVPGLPVQTKQYGTFPGGYYHLAYDGRLSPRAQQNEQATMAKLGAAAAYVRTTTKQGHVEARQQNVRLSVKLDLGVQFAHIEEVIHSLTHREMLSDVTRLLRDSKVQRAIYETAGDQVYRQFTNMLEDIAVGNKPADNLLDKSANFMRSGTQIAGLGWNLWTAAQQPLGIFNGMSRVGPAWVMRGMGRWLRDASTMQSTTKWIAEVSPMMRNRLDSGTQDLADLRQQLRQPGHWFDNLVRTVSADHLTQQSIIDGYLWHIGLMQRVADVPTWLGAYEKAMASSPNEPDAIARADQAVLDSQGGGQIKDLAQVQRGGPVAKLYMTFYSYGSTVLNASIDVAGATNYRSPSSVAALLGHLSLLYVLPALGTVAMAHAFGKAGGDDDDWTTWFNQVAKEAGSSALNGVVFLRELTGLFSDGTRGYEGPAGARFIQLLYKLGGQIKQGTLDEGLAKSANAVAGILFRYPSAQVQRTVDGFAALEEGRSTNPMVLLTGPPPKAAQ